MIFQWRSVAQASLDQINEEDELFSNSYLKALTSNENKKKQRKIREEREAQFSCGLNTLQAKLFIGKLTRKKKKEDSMGFPAIHKGIFLHNELKCKQTRKFETLGCRAQGPVGFPTTHMGILPLQRINHSNKRKKKKHRRQAMRTRSGSLCVWELRSIQKTQACKQREEKQKQEKRSINLARFPSSHDHVSLKYKGKRS